MQSSRNITALILISWEGWTLIRQSSNTNTIIAGEFSTKERCKCDENIRALKGAKESFSKKQLATYILRAED